MTPSTDIRRLALAGLVALAVGNGIGRFVFTPILPWMIEALALSPADAGFIASANYAGYLVGALVGATTWLRGSPRAWLVGGLVASAVTTGMVGLFSVPLSLAGVRFAGGVASAFVMVFGSAVVLQRGGSAAVHFAGVGVGVALSAAMVAALPLDWRGMWWASGAVSLIGALAAAWLLRGPAPSAGATDDAGTGREPLSLLVAYGLLGFGYVVTATFIVAIVRASPEARSAEPIVWLLVGLAAAPSVALWTWAGGKIGEVRAFALSCAIQAVGVAASVLVPTAGGAMAAALLLGGTYMGSTALGLTAARRLSAQPRHALARMTAGFGLGQMAGPLFAGLVAERTGGFLVPSLAAAGALVVAAALTSRPSAPRPRD